MERIRYEVRKGAKFVAKQTRQIILNMFESLLEEKDFDKITVVEIVGRCGINRNTFYYYFQDIYELLAAWLEQSWEKHIAANPKDTELQDVFLRTTSFVRAHKTSFYHIYRSISHVALRNCLEETSYANIAAYMEKKAAGLAIDRQHIQALATFYTAAMNGILLRWVHEDMPYDLELYIKRICWVMDQNIPQQLQMLVEENEACISM